MEMESRRIKKIEDAFHHAVANTLLFQVKDSSLTGLRVTHVTVTPDLSLARVYYDLPEGKVREPQVQKALKRSAGYFRHVLAEQVNLRRMPRLEFFYDETVEMEKNVEVIFEQLETEKRK